MRIKLLDSLHISEISRDTLVAGAKIDLPTTAANSLIGRGLAVKIEGNAKKKPKGKAAAKPANKIAPISLNKAAPSARNK